MSSIEELIRDLADAADAVQDAPLLWLGPCYKDHQPCDQRTEQDGFAYK